MKKNVFLISFMIMMLISCTTMNNDIVYIQRETKEKKVEKVPGKGYLDFLYTNSFGKLGLNIVVKRKFLTSIYGRYMSSPYSKKSIEKFVKELDIDMKESEKNIDEFTSFNDFFYRKLKKGSRLINLDEKVLVSPADGKILVFENIEDINKVYIKGKRFSLEKFLNDEKLYEKYKDGMMVIVRLSPKDYHRVHFPSDGKISKSKLINGYYYSVSPIAIRENFSIFFENKREISELKTKNFSDMLIIEVGATMVGGIKQLYTKDTYVNKGGEKSYFYFGGSTVVMILKKNSVKFDDDLIENSKNKMETTIKVGEKIAEKI